MTAYRSHKRSCPLCNEGHGESLLSLRYAMFDQSDLEPAFDMVTCSRCGFVYFDTSETYETLNTYYSSHLFYDTNPTSKAMGAHKPCMLRFDETATLISKHLHHRFARIVDIGANHGEQLLALKSRGYHNLCGIDLRQACVQSMMEIGVDAHMGTGEALPPAVGNMDLCIMSHTIEHMIDPMRVLKSIRQELVDNGMLYIEVPDAAAYPIHDVTQWHKFVFYEHLNHFDLAHLEMMANLCGFESVELGHKTISYRDAQANKDNQIASIFGLFKKGRGQPVDAEPAFETGAYLKRKFATNWRDPGGILEAASCSKNEVYLWGISQYAQLMLGSSPLRACGQLFLIDRDPFKQRQTIDGKAIRAPSTLKDIRADSIILLVDRQAAPAMMQYLYEIGCKAETHILGASAIEGQNNANVSQVDIPNGCHPLRNLTGVTKQESNNYESH